MRRDDLLHALGLDRVQPLERRPGDDVGARGDGDHVRRAALAPRPAARRPARARPHGSPTARRSSARDRPRRRPGVRGDARARGGITVVVGDQTASLAVLPEVSFFTATTRSFPEARLLRSLRIENFVLIREADLAFGPRLNAVTGETGAGKTILAQAIGLLLGAPGTPATSARGARRPTSRRSSTSRRGSSTTRARAPRRAAAGGGGRARRRPAGLRRRAHARLRLGPRGPREDLAALVERLLAMSGQFEQRRLARPSLPARRPRRLRRRGAAPPPPSTQRAWRELARRPPPPRRARAREAGRAQRLEELRQLVERTEGFAPGTEDALRRSASGSGT